MPNPARPDGRHGQAGHVQAVRLKPALSSGFTTATITTRHRPHTVPAMQTLDKSLEKRTKAAQRVLDTLDNWSQRLTGHISQKRLHQRSTYRANITVYIPNDDGAARIDDCRAECAWARNISCRGLSFLFDGLIRGNHVLVCLKNGRRLMWFKTEIVRMRLVHEGFWEYGVLFKGPAEI